MVGPHEDLDPPREMPAAAADILRTLEAFGFEWDGEVAYQSRRYDLYQDTLDRLKADGLVYPAIAAAKTGRRRQHMAQTDLYITAIPQSSAKTRYAKQNSGMAHSSSRSRDRFFRTALSDVRHKNLAHTISAISSRPCRRLLGISACRGC